LEGIGLEGIGLKGTRMITEDQLEQLCIEWFNTIGYDYVCGYDIAPGEPANESTINSERRMTSKKYD
jgi:hypothetical protein